MVKKDKKDEEKRPRSAKQMANDKKLRKLGAQFKKLTTAEKSKYVDKNGKVSFLAYRKEHT
jgi:hypothetical protein